MPSLESIFIVHADPALRTRLYDGLKAALDEAFEFEAFEHEAAAFRVLRTRKPVLLITAFDAGKDEYEQPFMGEMRRKFDLPVIATGPRNEDAEIRALDLGADDYIHDEKSVRLTAERIRVILRRYRIAAENRAASAFAGATEPDKGFIQRGLLFIDFNKRACTWKGKAVRLTLREFELMATLAQKPGHIKSRDALMAVIDPNDTKSDDLVIASHIKRMRKKFLRVDPGFSAIVTNYGVGYSLRPHESRPAYTPDSALRPQV